MVLCQIDGHNWEHSSSRIEIIIHGYKLTFLNILFLKSFLRLNQAILDPYFTTNILTIFQSLLQTFDALTCPDDTIFIWH